LTQDDDVKIYEAKPGLSPGLAMLLGLEAGPSFHFVLNDTVYKDNRIPPMGFTNARFDSVQASPVGQAYADGEHWDITTFETQFSDSIIAVEVSLFYQTASKEYVTFLKDENVTNEWGNTMYSLWEQYGKSPPELMEYNHWGEPIIDVDNDGFIAAVDCDDTDAQVHPGAIELADCLDNNCNGLVDEREISDNTWSWTGCAGSSSVHDGANWDRGIPFPGGANVQIGDSIGGSHYPILEDSVNIVALSVESGGLIEIGPTGSLWFTSSDPSTGFSLQGAAFNYGMINVTTSGQVPIMIGALGLFEMHGSMAVTGDSVLIMNSGIFDIESGSSVILSGNGHPKIVNMVGSIMTVEGEVRIEK
jgi:hypothetical protein